MAVLFHSGVLDAGEWVEALRRLDPSIDLRIWPELGDPAEIDTIMSWRPPRGTYARLPNLRLIYCTGAGVDQVLRDPELPPGLPLARVVDPRQAVEMSTWVAAAVLGRHRRFDDYRRQQAAGLWQRLPAGRETVGVMGMGEMGATVARTLSGLGLEVIGWSRTPRSLSGMECYDGPAGLGPFLARTGILVCLLPLTPETTDILSARVFDQLPEGAYVINAGRGNHLVEADLIAALDRGHLAGACLDVFRKEPLPAEHPFWRHPRIELTPHIACLAHADSVAPQIVENLRRLREGRPLLNQVDRARGY